MKAVPLIGSMATSDGQIARVHLKPTRHTLRMLGDEKTADRYRALLDNSTAVSALGRLMREAIEKTMSSDGRVNFDDAAAHVIGVMQKHPKAAT